MRHQNSVFHVLKHVPWHVLTLSVSLRPCTLALP